MRLRAPVLVLTLLTLAACTTADEPTPGQTSSSASSEAVLSVSTLPAGDFSYKADGNPQGTVYVTGYATIEKVQEPFCEQNCQSYDYVFFDVTEAGSEEFGKFLVENAGNSYADVRGRIGLGCKGGDFIHYENHSDRYGRAEYKLSEALSKAVLESTEERPVSLKLTKELLSGGSGAPACYAHFTDVSLWSEAPTAQASSSASDEPAQSGQQFAGAGCAIGGCSNQLCVNEGEGDIISTCEWTEAYACYQTARCEKQSSSSCGWTQTSELTRCLSEAQSPERQMPFAP